MRTKTIASVIPLILMAVMFTFCKGPVKENADFCPTNQQCSEDAIKSWMFENIEYPHYKPIVFGEIKARYDMSDRTLQLMAMIEHEEVASKDDGNTEKRDSLKMLLEENLGELLGFTILHKFNTADLAGDMVEMECLFLLDTAFRVASVLKPEEFDLILTEKVFYRIEQ